MKSAIQLIREVDRGQLLQDFEAALDDIVEAIEGHGGKGSITIKLSLSRKSDAYEVKGDLKFDLPAIVEADFNNSRKDNGHE